MILSLLRERESLWDILRRETRPIYLYGMGDGAQKALTAAAQFGILSLIHISGNLQYFSQFML